MLIYGKVILLGIILSFLPSNTMCNGKSIDMKNGADGFQYIHESYTGNQNTSVSTEEPNISENNNGYAEDLDTSESSISGTEEQTYDDSDAYDEIYDMLNLDKISDELSASGLGDRINFRDIISGIQSGNTEYVGNMLFGAAKSVLTDDLLANKTLMLQLVSIVLLGSIFVNLSGSFGNGFISENGFYITYLIITSIMLTSFSFTLTLVSDSIGKILTLIRIIVPVYALAMNFVGHTTAGVGMYEVILVGIWLVQVLIIKFIIPMIKFYVIISLVNNFNREDSFSKMCQLIKNIVGWLLKTIIVFTAGLNIIKSLIEPQIDALGRNTVNRIVSVIPGGNVMSVLTGTFLGAGMVIKNCIGVAGIVLLAIVVMAPVIKTFLLMLTVKLTAVMIQPIGEKRYVEGVESLAQGMSMLLQTLASSVVLFMLTIAIMAFATNGGS